MSRVLETTDYDPRYARAQTVEGAKARYVSDDLPGYGEAELEADLDRIIRFEGPNPDKPRAESEPILGGQVVRS